ncbi:MAG TPA: hypothetical protein VL693_03295 [Vicinamibacterales bacterium]|jgi:hypothetical protein|nr:hypothetical protein [Vicinamibacterales bacterium]
MLKRITGPQALTVVVVAMIIAVAGLANFSRAQAPQPPPVRIQVTTIQLKADMLTVWEDLQKNEMIPAQKKTGLPWRHTLANGATGQGFTRLTIIPLANNAQLDMPGFITRAISAEANANYNAKLRATILSQRAEIYTLEQDASLMSNLTAMPQLQLVQVASVLPGKGGEFLASMREDYLPNYRKAGVKDYWVWTLNAGGPGGQRVMVRLLDKYADIDRPALLQQAGLSQEQQNKIGARRNATLATPIENEVYRFIPELSYGLPTGAAAARATN